MDPKCKVALITGGASGIGLAMADHLLCNGAYRTILAGLDPVQGEKAVRLLNGNHGDFKACFMTLDVACDKQFEDCFKEMVAKFGRVDILCNNAGVLHDKNWKNEIVTNLTGVTLGVLLAMKYMQRQKHGGVVINTASYAGLDPFPYAPVNSATKFGVVGLTRSFGDEHHFKTTKTRVVGICPGVTDTEYTKGSADKQLTKELGAKAAAFLSSSNPQQPASVGRALIHLVKYARPGTCWLVENAQLFRMQFPDRCQIAEKIDAV